MQAMRFTLTFAAICTCLFGLLLLSGDPGFGTLLAWALCLLFFVAVVEVLLTVTGTVRFFSRRP